MLGSRLPISLQRLPGHNFCSSMALPHYDSVWGCLLVLLLHQLLKFGDGLLGTEVS